MLESHDCFLQNVIPDRHGRIQNSLAIHGKIQAWFSGTVLWVFGKIPQILGSILYTLRVNRFSKKNQVAMVLFG